MLCCYAVAWSTIPRHHILHPCCLCLPYLPRSIFGKFRLTLSGLKQWEGRRPRREKKTLQSCAMMGKGKKRTVLVGGPCCRRGMDAFATQEPTAHLDQFWKARKNIRAFIRLNIRATNKRAPSYRGSVGDERKAERQAGSYDLSGYSALGMGKGK